MSEGVFYLPVPHSKVKVIKHTIPITSKNCPILLIGGRDVTLPFFGQTLIGAKGVGCLVKMVSSTENNPFDPPPAKETKYSPLYLPIEMEKEYNKNKRVFAQVFCDKDACRCDETSPIAFLELEYMVFG